MARIYTPSSQKLEQVLFSENDQEWARDMRQRLQARAQATGARWQETLVDSALHQLVEYASGTLTSYCYPVISYPPPYSHIPEDSAPPITPDLFSRGWGARNLWGTLGLQFYWLITSDGELDRCRYCGRIISHTSPVPGSQPTKRRKTHSDKSFCNSRCRQNYHYHNRRKPQHKDGSNGDGKRPPG